MFQNENIKINLKIVGLNKIYYIFHNSHIYMYMYCIYIYIYIYIYNSFRYNVITCARLRLKQMWRLTKEKTEMKREH